MAGENSEVAGIVETCGMADRDTSDDTVATVSRDTSGSLTLHPAGMSTKPSI